MLDATGPSLFMAKTESLRRTSTLAQAGHATAVAGVATYRSNSWPHPAQRYSYIGIDYSPPRCT
jgi:hypothetical protein